MRHSSFLSSLVGGLRRHCFISTSRNDILMAMWKAQYHQEKGEKNSRIVAVDIPVKMYHRAYLWQLREIIIKPKFVKYYKGFK